MSHEASKSELNCAVAAVATGEMSSSLSQGLPEAAAALVNAHLTSLPAAARAANAAHIQQAMAAHAAAEAVGQPEPLLGLLMPNLHAVVVVVTGSHSELPGTRRERCYRADMRLCCNKPLDGGVVARMTRWIVNLPGTWGGAWTYMR